MEGEQPFYEKWLAEKDRRARAEAERKEHLAGEQAQEAERQAALAAEIEGFEPWEEETSGVVKRPDAYAGPKEPTVVMSQRQIPTQIIARPKPPEPKSFLGRLKRFFGGG
jgi:hypothetical protein